MSVYRLIFRLDYAVSYKIIDEPGLLMELVQTSVPNDYWNRVGENIQSRQISGSFESTDIVRKITIEPDAIVCTMESIEGFKLKELAEDENFSELIKVTNILCKKYNISNYKRVGLRVFYLSDIAAGTDNVLTVVKNVFDSELSSVVDEVLGTIDDYGVAFDGGFEDKFKYHLKYGPYLPSKDNIFENNHIKIAFSKRDDLDFVCDLDMYDNNVSLTGINLKKWVAPLAFQADEVISKTEEIIKKNFEG